MAEQQPPYSHAQAIEDGVIYVFDSHKVHEYKGNCMRCYRIGIYMDLCGHCNQQCYFNLWIVKERKPVNPVVVAYLQGLEFGDMFAPSIPPTRPTIRWDIHFWNPIQVRRRGYFRAIDWIAQLEDGWEYLQPNEIALFKQLASRSRSVMEEQEGDS